MKRQDSTTASNGQASEIFEIIAKESNDINEQISSLESQVFEHFRQEHFHLKINLRNVKIAAPRMIIFFIRASSQARRLGGDIELAHINPFVRLSSLKILPCLISGKILNQNRFRKLPLNLINPGKCLRNQRNPRTLKIITMRKSR